MSIPEFRETELLGIVMDFVSFRETFTPKLSDMRNIPFLSFNTFPFKFILYISAIIVLMSCRSDSPEKQSNDTVWEDSSTNDNTQNILSGPIPAESIRALQKYFNTEYSAIDGLNNNALKVEMNDSLINLIKSISSGTDKGLVFHYGYLEANKEICLLIGLGTQKKGEMKFSNDPFPAKPGEHPEYYLLFAAHEKHLKPKGLDVYKTLTDAYKDKITQNKTPITTNVDHPKMVYHQGEELKKFYAEYKMGEPLYLYAYNGSNKTQGVSKNYHVPIFLFGNETDLFPTDDFDYPRLGLNFPYRNKALDAGHVCPPHCIKIAPQN